MEKKLNAYLIMAHHEPELLKKLLRMLDDRESDIYIHLDKKSKDMDESELKKSVNLSEVYFVKRTNVMWGGDSQIRCELLLLSEAVKRGYDYYHSLSGVDLLLKPPAQINAFFRANKGKSFVALDLEEMNRRDFYARIDHYYLFQNFMGRKYGRFFSVLARLEKACYFVQKACGVNRVKNLEGVLKKGTSWFDITHDLAMYLLSKQKFIKKHFYHSMCADEIFLQIVAYMSPFANDLINRDLRCIDWKRGTPYTYRLEDYEMLVSSEELYARKFSLKTDADIVDKLSKYVMEKKEGNA